MFTIAPLVRLAFLAITVLVAAYGPPAHAQQSPGPYKDARELPKTPAGQRLSELIGVVNANDRARTQKFTEDTFTAHFRGAVPLDEHLNVFGDVARTTGGLDFYGVRSYAEPRPDTQIVAILRAKLTGSWQAIVLEVEPEPPHRIASLQFRPARPPSDLPPLPKLKEAELALELRTFVERLAAADAFSGTVLLARGGKVLFEEAYGQADKNFGVANQVDTKFNLGSMNKMFTATAVMQLVERGKLRLDDTLGKHLSGEWLPAEVADRITIEHLLTHTSGLGSYFNDKYDALPRDKLRAVNDYKALVAEDRPAFDPGTRWAYSNTGMLLLGAVIEKVTGGDYFDYVRKNIYEPAKMANSDCYDLDRVVPNLAIGYTRVSDAAGTHWETNTFKHVIRGGPAGGGYSTVADLLRFDRAVRDGRLVSSESTAKMWTATPQSDQGGGGYGYGFGVFTTPQGKMVGHTGGFVGISSTLQMYLDAGYTLAVMSNYDGGAQVIEQKVAELLGRLE